MNIFITGASKGLGNALAQGLNRSERHFYLLSRTEPQAIQQKINISATWIKTDLSNPEFISEIKSSIKDKAIDVLIYNAGIWEQNGFGNKYNFEENSPLEITRIISVNLTSAILCVQCILPNLRKASAAKIILIGSTSGLDNNQSMEVAYQASKFGLRGLNNALRENLRETKINSTIINLGSLSTQIPYEESKDADLNQPGHSNIPFQDVVEIINCIINLSPSTLIKEIDIPCSTDMSL